MRGGIGFRLTVPASPPPTTAIRFDISEQAEQRARPLSTALIKSDGHMHKFQVLKTLHSCFSSKLRTTANMPSWARALEAFNAEAKRDGGPAAGTFPSRASHRRRREDAGSPGSKRGADAKAGQIPRFFKPKVEEETFDKHVKLATIHEYVQSSNERVLSSWNLEGVWGMIVQNSEEHPDTKEKFITYAGVCNMAETLFEMLGPLLSFHFTPSRPVSCLNSLSHVLNSFFCTPSKDASKLEWQALNMSMECIIPDANTTIWRCRHVKNASASAKSSTVLLCSIRKR